MTIKGKTSLYISIVFTLLFGVVCLIIITLFSNFRKQEFEERLNEKALTSIKLLIDVQEVDTNLLKIIDQNTINQLYDEKTLLFDGKYNLIYSSLDDTEIKWTVDDLKYLKEHRSFFKTDKNENEIYGIYYDSNNEDYFALVSANDNYGKRKLYYLIYILIGAYVLFVVATWVFTFYIIKNQFKPLDVFHKNIRDINDLNSESKLEINSESNNEIDLLSNEFNFMMSRISDAYQKQREFTSQASHELRTPLARISVQLENQIQQSNATEQLVLKNIFKDIILLKELINSLLILSKIDVKEISKNETSRIDEVIYNSIETVSHQFKSLKINFNINTSNHLEDILNIKCNQNLLEIAFTNLLKNAYLYSDNQTVTIEIKDYNNSIAVSVNNTGETLSEEEQKRLFQPFMRGKNAKQNNGLGLGLRIVHRILSTYGFKIEYQASKNQNIFTLFFH